MSQRTKVAGAALVLGLVIAFLFPAPGHSAAPPGAGQQDPTDGTSDADDAPGRIDVRAVTHAITGDDTVTYTITTYEPFALSDISRWLLFLDLGSGIDTENGACIAMERADTALRSGVLRGGCRQTVPSGGAVSHVDGTDTLTIRVPLRELRDAGLSGSAYRYVLATQVSNPRCPPDGVGCEGAEDFVAPVTHQLAPATQTSAAPGKVTSTAAAPSTTATTASTAGGIRPARAAQPACENIPGFDCDRPVGPSSEGGSQGGSPAAPGGGSGDPVQVRGNQAQITQDGSTGSGQAGSSQSLSAPQGGSTAARARMARTGADPGPLLLAAAGAIGLGLALVAWGKRRKDGSPSNGPNSLAHAQEPSTA